MLMHYDDIDKGNQIDDHVKCKILITIPKIIARI